MISKKDKESIQNAKKLIGEQIEATKKLNLGLDADSSSNNQPQSKSIFAGFINKDGAPTLDGK